MPFSPCQKTGCSESAVSFSRFCWPHHDDHKGYLAALPEAIRNAPAGPLNLKKVHTNHIEGIDFSHKNLAGSSLSQASFAHANFVGTDLSESNLIGATFINCDFIG